MTDPKDNDLQERKEHKKEATKSQGSSNYSDWDSHQQIDEKGNEISLEDIK